MKLSGLNFDNFKMRKYFEENKMYYLSCICLISGSYHNLNLLNELPFITTTP